MGTLTGKVALVTGASRGVGKGIAQGLGEAGATVYVTGRTTREGEASVALAGTVGATAQAVNQAGGKGIPLQCDHRNSAQVQEVFEQVKQEEGRLDLLVNNAWAGYEGWVNGKYAAAGAHFWEKPLTYWDENLEGLRWAYTASLFAAPLLLVQGGLIVNISNGVPNPGDPAYSVAKSGTDRLTVDMAEQLREHKVAVVTLYPGLVRTENVLVNAEWFDMTNSQAPLFSGRAVAALAADPKIMDKTGKVFVVADLAREYGFEDVKD
ncbi:MAG: SDR family NAD(P)-dependent oxidoreductase [Chloroflexota bacterium]